jgi:hypothetical protein
MWIAGEAGELGVSPEYWDAIETSFAVLVKLVFEKIM